MLGKHKPAQFTDGEDIYSTFITTHINTHIGHIWLKPKVSVYSVTDKPLAGTIILNNMFFQSTFF